MTTTLKTLPNPCKSITHRAIVDKTKFFFTVSLFENGQPGGLQITCDQSGSTIDGALEAWATSISRLFQRGESLKWMVKMYSYQQFDPKGKTDNVEIPLAFSPVDYIVRWMALTFKEPIPKQTVDIEELKK